MSNLPGVTQLVIKDSNPGPRDPTAPLPPPGCLSTVMLSAKCFLQCPLSTSQRQAVAEGPAPPTQDVCGPRNPAGHGVTRGSGRKTEDPRGHCPPDLPRGALRIRAGNSCWLPGFRAIIKNLLGSRCLQRGFQRDGPELN